MSEGREESDEAGKTGFTPRNDAILCTHFSCKTVVITPGHQTYLCVCVCVSVWLVGLGEREKVTSLFGVKHFAETFLIAWFKEHIAAYVFCFTYIHH